MTEEKMAEVSLMVNTLISHIDGVRSQLQQVQSDLPQIKEDVKSFGQLLADHKEIIKTLSKELANTKANVAALHDEHARNLATAKKALSDAMDEKHKNYLEMVQQYKSLKEEIRKFDMTIEGITLDAKNAVLKSNNNDLQLQLNQKKLENVQLQLKNRELMK